MTDCKFIYTGKMEIWSQEGGYASPSLEIGKEDLTGDLENKLMEIYKEKGDHTELGELPGSWMITIERVSE